MHDPLSEQAPPFPGLGVPTSLSFPPSIPGSFAVCVLRWCSLALALAAVGGGTAGSSRQASGQSRGHSTSKARSERSSSL
eukprot:158827-Rhodomonas_salina.1